MTQVAGRVASAATLDTMTTTTTETAVASTVSTARTAIPLLRQMFDAAVAAAQPERCLAPYLERIEQPRGRLVIVGAGKAAAGMAQVAEAHWRSRGVTAEGVVVTRYGQAAACDVIAVLEAAHPVPDAAGMAAAARILRSVQGLSADDTVLCLISGGGSALLPLPLAGITLAEKQAVTRALLQCGASIGEMNCLRRHLSAIKGGRLAAACHPARVVSLLISDVPGDDPADIASGPTVADPTSCADALAIVRRYGIELPPAVEMLLTSGAGESIKPGDARLARCETHLVAAPQAALDAAARVAEAAGVAAHILGDALEGEARELGRVLGGMALQVARRQQPFATPCVLLSGGETTVTVRGTGCGGRNVEFLLSLALTLRGAPGVFALAADTDGVDGVAEIAGAWLTPETLARAHALGLSPRAALDDNDAHTFFQALGQSLMTGPTGTNVNDFRAILVGFQSISAC
jgi:hydroxypyruvate reductase